MAPVQPGTNHALNALRTVAALLVVVGHARRTFLQGSEAAGVTGLPTDVAYLLTSLEHPAVLVFFALSGYLVGGSVVREVAAGAFSWTRYLVNRGVRLWIVLLPALVLTVALDLLGRTIAPHHYKYRDAPLEVADVLGTALFAQLSAVDVPGTNAPLWSLAFEASYYLAFPLLYVGLLRGRGRGRLLAGLLLVVLLVAPLPAIWVLFPPWLAGVGVAAAEPAIRTTLATWTPARVRLTRAGVLVLLGFAVVADRASTGDLVHSASPASYLVAIATAALVALLLPDLHPVRPAPRRMLSGLSALSESSYSLYVVHMPILVLLAATVHPVADRADLWAPGVRSWLAVGAAVVLAVGCGHAFAAVTERHTGAVRRLVLRQSVRTNDSPSRLNPSRS